MGALCGEALLRRVQHVQIDDALLQCGMGLIFTGAVLSALFAAWQLQRPLRRLSLGSVAACPLPPCANAAHFGVAHDLRTPLARLLLRAEMLDDAKARDGVVRDVDSMIHIVDQFLVFAHDGTDRSEPVGVDQQ